MENIKMLDINDKLLCPLSENEKMLMNCIIGLRNTVNLQQELIEEILKRINK